MSEIPTQRQKVNQATDSFESGIFNERILVLVFESLKWDIRDLCQTASVNHKLRAVAKRLLWRELCVYRAPRMIASLLDGLPNSRISGGWQPIAKLLFFCCGCESSRHFRPSQPLPGHFVKESRFSKTSGRSFLAKKCRGDVLYLSDPCEHPAAGREYDLGVYRGIFRGFKKSRTLEYLINRRVEFEEKIRCPYCGTRVWSMTAARLVPKRSAARRLGSQNHGLEYFVCLNGHLHGTCLLVPLSSDEEDDDDESNDDLGDRNSDGQ
ncbi:EID1-like F-box protein 3 [Forsythia ovata]|uniref:EID1-like F-box protein 3 n=1 Tax=Forsythia ovata TaxID=205694 RepID=A0ABD1X4F0_9LAMI